MIITRTPLRISFIGGGTDLKCFYENHGGAIVNAAIDKYVYVMVKERFLKHHHYMNHPFIQEAMKMVNIKGGIDIYSWNDLPHGNGLGSSGSYLVGLLKALYSYRGIHISGDELAEAACKIEIDILDAPVGKQDQYVAVYGGLRYYSFGENGVDKAILNLSYLQGQNLNSRLMLFYLGITRTSESILKEQVKNTDKIVSLLKYVRDQAIGLKELAGGNDLDIFGKVMNRGWQKKKGFASNITTPEIDAYYSLAVAAGAIGGKVVGAGGGGFLLFYVPEKYQDDVRDALSDLKELPFNIVDEGSKVLQWT